MFEAFAPTPADSGRRKRFAASTGAAAAIYVAIGSAILVLAGPEIVEKDEDLLDVTFEHVVKKDVPPPPPPPPVAEAPKPKPKPRAAMVAPTEIPLEKPAEADPGALLALNDGNAGLDPTAAVADPVAEAKPQIVEAAIPPPPPKPKARKADPVNLPEEAEAPEPDPGNEAPRYPDAARTAGLEGKVILRIVISETGAVTDIKVLRGDPMLAEAAIAAVKNWKFSPAMLDGKPIAVFRILPLAFTSAVAG